MKEIAAMIQFVFNKEYNMNISIFNDKIFQAPRDVLNAVMKNSANFGTVKIKRKATVIDENSENEMWLSGSLGHSNSKQLLNT